jgi:hypothetical protein
MLAVGCQGGVALWSLGRVPLAASSAHRAYENGAGGAESGAAQGGWVTFLPFKSGCRCVAAACACYASETNIIAAREDLLWRLHAYVWVPGPLAVTTFLASGGTTVKVFAFSLAATSRHSNSTAAATDTCSAWVKYLQCNNPACTGRNVQDSCVVLKPPRVFHLHCKAAAPR